MEGIALYHRYVIMLMHLNVIKSAFVVYQLPITKQTLTYALCAPAVNEVTERLAFFSIAVNMVAYLFSEMHQSLPDAATHVTDWIGAAYVLTLLGAFLADAYLGRFRTILIFSAVYAAVNFFL